MKVDEDSSYSVIVHEDDTSERGLRISHSVTEQGDVIVFAGEGGGVRIKGVALRDALLKAFPIDGGVDWRDLPATEDEEPADKDAVLSAAAQYADRKANAAWLIAYQDHLNSVLTTKENA